MVSLNNITDALRSFGTSNPFLEKYSIGLPSDLDASKDTDYPLMHVVYNGASYATGVKTYTFDIIFIGQVSALNATTEEVKLVSDLEQVAEDLIADVTTGHVHFAFDEQYELISASVSPVFEQERNIATGCSLSLTIEVPMSRNGCIAPV